MSYFERPDDPLRDDEYPEQPDAADDEATSITCPECGAAVYEDAEQCPGCGRWLTDADRHGPGGPLAGWPLGWIILGVLGVLATLWALLAFR